MRLRIRIRFSRGVRWWFWGWPATRITRLVWRPGECEWRDKGKDYEDEKEDYDDGCGGYGDVIDSEEID